VDFGLFQPTKQQIEPPFRLFLSNVALSQQGKKEAENWLIYA